ncbi:MAG: DUF1700 domain-containing protein [Patescibacteria group bacterium]
MKQETFIKNLKLSLNGLSKAEIDEVVADYLEYFEAGAAEKRSEDEIAKSLGDPRAIGKQIRATARIKKAEDQWSATNITRAVLATAGLGMLNLIFVFGPFMGLVGVLIGLFGTGIGITAGGIAGTIASIVAWSDPDFASNYINIGAHPAAILLLSAALVCFGLIFTVGCSFLAKWFYILTVKYLRLNARVITGEKE